MSELATTDSSPDVYVRQLREIFLASDSSGSGLLNRDDLERLCRRLNLESDIAKQITDSLCVAADDQHRVGFDEFKETFVNILTETEQETGDDDDDDDDATKMRSGGRMGLDGGVENAIDLSDEERHLLGIWKELGVGVNGSLTLSELHRVCRFLNMGHMTNKDVEQLFARLDIDGDGLVSFGELLHGLFEIGEIGRSEELPSVIHDARMLSLPLEKSSHNKRSLPTQSSRSLHAHEGILALLDKEGSGFAESGTIVELWDSLGVREGQMILKLLRFDVRRPVSLLDLSLALVDEIHAIQVDNNIVYEAALITIEHALDHLHSVNEDLKLERDRLLLDLSLMKKRNAAIVEEFDELYSAEDTRKTKEQRLASVENETKFEKVLSQLRQKSDDNDQLQRHLNEAKQEVASVVERLHLSEKKCCSLEKELEQKEADIRLEQQQQMTEMEPGSSSSPVVNGNYETELRALMRGMSTERKDIEGAFRLEITELEQRHLDQLSSMKTEFEKEKDDLMSGHKRHLAEALAERERDLLTEFAKEAAEHSVERAELKELQKRLRLTEKEEEDEDGSAAEAQDSRRYKTRHLEMTQSTPQDIWSAEEERMRKREEETGKQALTDGREDEEDEMERWKDEKQKMMETFKQDLATTHQEHEQELAQLNNDLAQRFHLEMEEAMAAFDDERRTLELKVKSMEHEMQKEEDEKERYKKEAEKELEKKELERELYMKELEEQLRLKELENEIHRTELERDLKEKEEDLLRFKNELDVLHTKDLEKEIYTTELERDLKRKEEENLRFKNELEEVLSKKELTKEINRTELERDLRRKEEEKEQLRKDLEQELKRKEEENDLLRSEIEKLKRLNDTNELEKRLKGEPLWDRRTDDYLKQQIDELCRKNVRLKDELDKRDGELLRLRRQEMERSDQLKRNQQTGSGDDQRLMTMTTVAMSEVKDVLVERDIFKRQLQLTVKQLADATSALSLVSDELKKEKEGKGQMVEKVKYDDVIMRLRETEAKAHHLKHDCQFRAAETTKLLSLSQTVNRKRLSHLMEENEKMDQQMKQRKRLINEQLMKIEKQREELLKSDALIRDLYMENAHLVRCLQKTEGNRQDSDVKVQLLHQKCIDLGRLLSTVGPLAINHR